MSPLSAEELDGSLPKKWEVTDRLGQGGQGTVYLGSLMGRAAAIKLFHDDGDVARVTREIQALKNVQCANVVGLLGFCSVVISGQVLQVVAYEYLEGGDLTCYLKGNAAPRRVLCQVAIDMCTALEALWSMNIVHRDVKPANIVQAAVDRFVLVDLAFARHLDESSLTQTGWTVGTRSYMSPEHQRAWKNLTIDSDVYSLGVSLFELATGGFPEPDLAQAAATLASRRPDLGDELVEMTVSMLAPLPYERPQVETLRPKLAALVQEP